MSINESDAMMVDEVNMGSIIIQAGMIIYMLNI